jgi:hypothetical protein
MTGKVTTWVMTEEERLAYIKKHPIKQTKKTKSIYFEGDYPDYKWRSEKGNAARWEK